jgi:hypothetical protein
MTMQELEILKKMRRETTDIFKKFVLYYLWENLKSSKWSNLKKEIAYFEEFDFMLSENFPCDVFFFEIQAFVNNVKYIDEVRWLVKKQEFVSKGKKREYATFVLSKTLEEIKKELNY